MPVLRPLMGASTAQLEKVVTPIQVFEYDGRPVQNTAIYRINNPLRVVSDGPESTTRP